MKQHKVVAVYNKGGEIEHDSSKYTFRYFAEKFFTKPVRDADYVISKSDAILAAYKAVGVGEYPESLNNVQEPVQPPTPEEPAPTDPTPETVQKETDHLTHDEIRSAPFFTQKKMVKEKYGVVAKNKEEIEAVLADNE